MTCDKIHTWIDFWLFTFLHLFPVSLKIAPLSFSPLLFFGIQVFKSSDTKSIAVLFSFSHRVDSLSSGTNLLKKYLLELLVLCAAEKKPNPSTFSANRRKIRNKRGSKRPHISLIPSFSKEENLKTNLLGCLAPPQSSPPNLCPVQQL